MDPPAASVHEDLTDLTEESEEPSPQDSSTRAREDSTRPLTVGELGCVGPVTDPPAMPDAPHSKNNSGLQTTQLPAGGRGRGNTAQIRAKLFLMGSSTLGIISTQTRKLVG